MCELNYDNLLNLSPYSISQKEKEELLTINLNNLTVHHQQNCIAYKNILSALYGTNKSDYQLSEIPYLPVRLFKQYELKSVPQEELFKTMTSSGTTGQQVSRIYLDRETSTRQSKVLAKITSDFIGKNRLPMIILDTSAIVKNREMFSARGAGIMGFSIFARDKMYALNENMELQIEEIQNFLKKHEGSPIFLFGFTFMIWQHVISEMKKKNFHPDFSNAILIHGGGWKKLADKKITNSDFKQALLDTCSLTKVHDYYGMVEQTGTIYMECEHGRLHSPVWADIIIRSTKDFSVLPVGEKGLIQVLSILPTSYPGHSLLTEDEGIITGIDDCPCGRKGKTISICGRIARAELRGCSDTYEPTK